MAKSYFISLFKANKTLFVFVLLFFLINIVANVWFVTQITPIYNWSLYSSPVKSQETYSFLKIQYNHNKVLKFKHTWEEPTKLFLLNTMNLFVALKVEKKSDPIKEHYINSWLPRHSTFHAAFKGFKNYNDDKEFNRFPYWYERYLEQVVNENVTQIDVYETRVGVLKDGTVKQANSKLIYSYNER